MNEKQKKILAFLPAILIGGGVLAFAIRNRYTSSKTSTKKKAQIIIEETINAGKDMELPSVVYNKAFANLREQPYTTAKVLQNYAIPHDSFYVIDGALIDNYTWYQVNDGGDLTGWFREDVVTLS